MVIHHWSFVAVVLLAVAPCLHAESLDSLHIDVGDVAPFQLTERSERTISRDDLHGKVWIAQFFFRCCSQGCPQTTASMARLQEAFAGDPRVVLVSFTLDPENDTPEELRRYAADHGADPERWLFLTGSEKGIHELAQRSFFQSVQRIPDTDPDKRYLHTFNLMVVDQHGKIRGYASGKEPDNVPLLEKRVRELLGPPLIYPTINASLNGIAGLLLVAGYVAIRRRRESLHKACMLSALVVSIVFLACYLYYHIVVLRGESVRFQGEGWVRPLYFAVLITHIVLAPIVAILALVTAYLGLRERRQGHVRLARWTWPLWMYVSITGVLVYLMLYHWF